MRLNVKKWIRDKCEYPRVAEITMKRAQNLNSKKFERSLKEYIKDKKCSVCNYQCWIRVLKLKWGNKFRMKIINKEGLQ